MGIGNKLKQEREAKNLSLEDIREKTKIQTRYLDAIEKENFDMMPGNFYVRAFIKEYASAVGLDPDRVMEDYANELPSPPDKTSLPSTRGKGSKNTSTIYSKAPSFFSFVPTLMVVMVVIGIFVSIWFSQQSSSNGKSEGINSHETTEGVEEVVVTPEEEVKNDNNEQQTEDGESREKNTEPALEVVDQGVQGNDVTLTYALTNPKEDVVLMIDTDSEHWLQVTNAKGESLYNAMFKEENAPLREDMTGQDNFIIRFGNPSELDVVVGGIPLQLPEDTNKSLIHQVTIEVENKSETE